MIKLIGLNHKSAPIDVRSKFVFCEEDIKRFVPMLKEKGMLGAVVLSTCNRTEIYVEFDSSKGKPNFEAFENTLFEYRKADKELMTYFYKKSHDDVVRHLFHVVSGLDSMALGEYQIVGQVKDAFNVCENNKLVSPILKRLFTKAFEAGKKVRTDTNIGLGAVSISYAAVNLANTLFNNLSSQPVLLIGAGQTSELTIQNLVKKGCNQFTIVNRTFDNAVEMAKKHNAKAEEMSKIDELLLNNNIVIASTASKKALITREMVEKAMEKRNYKELFFVDLSVPRNIATDVIEVDNVHVFDIDDLSNVVDATFEKRRAEVCAAEEIIEEAVIDFGNWVHTRNLIPIFQNICKYFHGINKAEMEDYAKAQKIELPKAFADQITNKLIHNMITNVKTLTENGKKREYIPLVNQLFNQN
ncbi:MAG: glutamyl-tRNA reductase [Bacteroidetes bacterium]|nr:glutamyl-tRNA reductase [Bacteroidota bacterium]